MQVPVYPPYPNYKPWLLITWQKPGLLKSSHYADVIMGAIASQITSLTIVYSIVYSDADQRKHQSSASLAFVWGNHRDRWIPSTKGQLLGKCFHLMTSSWNYPNYLGIFQFQEWKGQYKVMVVFVIVEKISQHLFLYITCYHSYRLHIIWHCEQTLIYNLLWQIYGTNNCWFPLARKWPTWKWTWIWIQYGKIEKKCPRYFRRDSRGNPRDPNMCRTGRSAALSRGRKSMPPRRESMKLVV